MRHCGPFVKMRELLVCLFFTSNMLQRMGTAAEEMKHNLPGNLEIVDPKSLGLGDADLEKFLGNVKVLPINGQTGNNVKTEILTVGFNGDEKLNLADFDGLSTDGLPDHEKQVAHAAFQSFQNFFRNPSSSQNFDDVANNNRPPHGHHMSQNHQPRPYQEPPRMQPYNQNQAQRPQYQQRDTFREITQSPRPASHGGSQPNQYYRLNPHEVNSLLTATEASTGRAKAPQIYSLNESAFPRHLANIMGISTSIERPRAMQPPRLPPSRPHQHVQSQPIYVTPPPQVHHVQSPTGSPPTHNPYNHQFPAGPTHNTHNIPQPQHRPHSDTRYTATSSIQQNHYIPLQPRPTIQTSTHNPQSPNHFGSHNAHQQPTLPAPQGTYKPPVGQPPRQPQHQIQHTQPQQQHPHTYFTQNYVLQPSIGFQVPNPLPAPQSPLTTPRGISGHIDQGKSNRPTGQQIFHQATAASTHTPALHIQQSPYQINNPPVNHNQYQQQHNQGMPFVQIVRQNHAKTMKDVFTQQSLSQHQQNNQQAGSDMLAQIHIHHANHKHPTILNIHQPQPPHQQPAKPANSYQQYQQQQQQQQQQYKPVQPFSNGHVDIYPQQNNVQVNPGPQAFQIPGFVRQNSHEQAGPTSYQRPQNHPAQPAPQSHNSVAIPTPHTPSNSLAPPILIATTQPPLFRPEAHGNIKDTRYNSPYHGNSLIQGAPSHLHAQHLLPNSYQQTLLERQRETQRRPPAPPPHPPPPSVPYSASHINGQVDYRAPRTLAEASLPRRFKYEEWPLHRNDRADVDTEDSMQNNIDSSADLDEEGSEHAIAITKQLFDPDMIETIQPAQMIAYGHVTTSEKPEEQ